MRLRHFNQTRRLFTALRRHREIAFISDEEHELLDRAAALISDLVTRRHHYSAQRSAALCGRTFRVPGRNRGDL